MEHRPSDDGHGTAPTARRVSIILFDGFELLDVFGPAEVFGLEPDRFAVTLVGPAAGPVTSATGPRALADISYHDAAESDIVMVPGGQGTRRLVTDARWLGWLAEWARPAGLITSVCTGSAVLAAAGLLDGHRATSNRRAFAWASSFGQDVGWVADARWVHDGSRWTSAGVSAGIDMALALVADLHGDDAAHDVATRMEYATE
ncbi:MAG: DJ-1/PfpI family protein [Bifidobacteriaceae bacterium]|jgi:transcriptional regulator GlxA family with amidase domain|nr:DJ-1/PfpI family protein [Bifidobacteriaceae bacterium]